MKQILLFSLLICSSFISKAQILGGEIDYRCLGNGRYEVFATIQVYCGDSLITPSIYGKTGTTVFMADSIEMIAIEDVQAISSHCTSLDSCMLDSNLRRIIRMRYRGVFDFSAYSSCQLLFYVREAVNNNSFSLLNKYNFYVFTEINRCLAPCDNSPIGTENAAYYFPHSRDVFLNQQVYNANFQADSFVYSFVAPLNDYTAPAGYYSPYSVLNWLTFFGSPNINLPWPAGLHIDLNKGFVTFRPALRNQEPTMAIEIKIFRKINGVMTYIGRKHTENRLQVFSETNNSMPQLAGPYSKFICNGEKSCFTIQATDADSADSTSLAFYSADIPEIEVTQLTTGKHPEYTLCWTPDSSDAQITPYTIYAVAKDKHCPIQGIGIRAYSFRVNHTPPNELTIIPNQACDSTFLLHDSLGIHPNLIRSWSVYNDKKNLVSSYSGNRVAIDLDSGKYYVELFLNGYNYCNFNLSDSFINTGHESPKIAVTEHFRLGCIGQTDTIGVTLAHGKYTYSWQDGLQDSLRIIQLSTDTTNYALISKNGVCTRTDSFWVYASPAPDLIHQAIWSGKDQLHVEVLHPALGANYSWYLDHSSLAIAYDSSAFIQTPGTVSHFIRLKAQQYRCVVEDTFTVAPAVRTSVRRGIGDAEYSIFPNPFTESIHIEGKGLIRIVLYDALGSEQFVSFVQGDSFTLVNLEKLPAAVYLLRIETEEGLVLKKIIKQ